MSYQIPKCVLESSEIQNEPNIKTLYIFLQADEFWIYIHKEFKKKFTWNRGWDLYCICWGDAQV